MAAGHLPGRPGVADRLPLGDALPLGDRKARQVVVHGRVRRAVDGAVVDHHLVTVGAVAVGPPHSGDFAGGGGELALPAARAQVDPVVHEPAPGDRVHPVPVRGGDVQRAGDRRNERAGTSAPAATAAGRGRARGA